MERPDALLQQERKQILSAILGEALDLLDSCVSQIENNELTNRWIRRGVQEPNRIKDLLFEVLSIDRLSIFKSCVFRALPQMLLFDVRVDPPKADKRSSATAEV